MAIASRSRAMPRAFSDRADTHVPARRGVLGAAKVGSGDTAHIEAVSRTPMAASFFTAGR